MGLSVSERDARRLAVRPDGQGGKRELEKKQLEARADAKVEADEGATNDNPRDMEVRTQKTAETESDKWLLSLMSAPNNTLI